MYPRKLINNGEATALVSVTSQKEIHRPRLAFLFISKDKSKWILLCVMFSLKLNAFSTIGEEISCFCFDLISQGS